MLYDLLLLWKNYHRNIAIISSKFKLKRLFRVLLFNILYSYSTKILTKTKSIFLCCFSDLIKCYFIFFLLSFTYNMKNNKKSKNVNVETFIKIFFNWFYVFKHFSVERKGKNAFFVVDLFFEFNAFVEFDAFFEFDFNFLLIGFFSLIQIAQRNFQFSLINLFLKSLILKRNSDFFI